MFKALALAILGLVYAVYALNSVLEDKALESRGKTAQIEPMEKITQITRKKRSQPDKVSYNGDVTFTTEAGQSITIKRALAAPLVQKVAQGQPVSIRYLPENPTKVRLEGQKGADMSDIVVGLVVFIAGGLWFRKKLNEQPRLA